MTLSEYASEVFGGTISDSEALESRVQSAIAELSSNDPDRLVVLGRLIYSGVGVCRHRAILYKYLCDHMHRFPERWGLTAASQSDGSGVVRGAVPCQLVRGVQSDGAADGSDVAQNHMWNVVRLGSDLFVVDVMQRAGQLLAADSKEAQAYQRAIQASAEPSGVHPQVRASHPLREVMTLETLGEQGQRIVAFFALSLDFVFPVRLQFSLDSL